MKRRVVVTGMGAITPIGNSVAELWNGLKEGKLGFGPITLFDGSANQCKLVAEVKDFDPTNYMDVKSSKRMGRFAQFAMVAAAEAVEMSGLDMEKEDPFMVGCAISSGVGSMQIFESEFEAKQRRGPRGVNPFFVPILIGNMAAGNVSIKYGMMGKNINIVTACASGTNSIGEALRAIQYGDADVMLAGGAEAPICSMGVAGFDALKSLSLSTDPTRCSIPFDAERGGFVLGEGCGVLVLEEYEHAKKRGAKIIAEVAGYGATGDAYHVTSPRTDGLGAAKAMELAIRDAGITPEDIQYVNAHGTGTKYNDLFETRAIKTTFGEHAYQLKVNSTKSMTGHLVGAAGAVEAIVCLKTLQEGYIHKTAGLQSTEEELDLDYCKEACEMDVTYALSNSLGFGGHNGSLVFKKYKEA